MSSAGSVSADDRYVMTFTGNLYLKQSFWLDYICVYKIPRDVARGQFELLNCREHYQDALLTHKSEIRSAIFFVYISELCNDKKRTYT